MRITTQAVVANQYLEGALTPVTEEITAVDLEVRGHIPDHLSGRYLRNSTNPVAEVNPAIYHWFSGDAMVHGLALGEGDAQWYRNRWVRTPRASAALGEQPGVHVDPRAGMLAYSANTNVLAHAGSTLALVEAGNACFELTEDLDTVGTCDFDGTLFGGYTAHPHRDPDTGELHAVSYSFARGNRVQYSVIDAAGRARRTVDIEVVGAPMMHDFSLTDRYVVIYDLPVTFDLAQMIPRTVPRRLGGAARLVLNSLIGKVTVPTPLATQINRRAKHADYLPFAWNPSYPSRIGVMPREGTGAEVRWFDIEPCYVYHPLNAYSEFRDGAELLILDVVRNEKMFERDLRGPSEGNPTLDRWTLNLTTGAVNTQRYDDRLQEFPRINEAFTGRKHRYGYTMSIDGGSVWTDSAQELRTGVYKHDYETGRSLSARLDPDVLVGEVCFVPNPGATAEDDGVLMGFGLDLARDLGQFFLFDAETLESMATVDLPQRIPMGFHGNWAPGGVPAK